MHYKTFLKKTPQLNQIILQLKMQSKNGLWSLFDTECTTCMYHCSTGDEGGVILILNLYCTNTIPNPDPSAVHVEKYFPSHQSPLQNPSWITTWVVQGTTCALTAIQYYFVFGNVIDTYSYMQNLSFTTHVLRPPVTYNHFNVFYVALGVDVKLRFYCIYMYM